MSLCFFGATDRDLAKSDQRVGPCEILVQRQRMLTFSDALGGAPGQHFDEPQPHMPARMVGNRR